MTAETKIGWARSGGGEWPDNQLNCLYFTEIIFHYALLLSFKIFLYISSDAFIKLPFVLTGSKTQQNNKQINKMNNAIQIKKTNKSIINF